MKIGIYSTFDELGGAARATNRLHRGLIDKGYDSNLILQNKTSNLNKSFGPNSKIQIIKNSIYSNLNQLPLKLYKNKSENLFSPNLFSPKNKNTNFDIYNFHWINNGFISINQIAKIDKPIVLTLHDSWFFTGGCHLPNDCLCYINKCQKCPKLNSRYKNDLSSYIWEKKFKLWSQKNFLIVGDSNWIINCAKKSPIFQNSNFKVINPGLDLSVYRPLDKIYCKSLLGLNHDSIVITYGAYMATKDKNKGFHYLVQSLNSLSNKNDITLLIFGATSSDIIINNEINVKYLGHLKDDLSLSIIYSASDVMLVPSIQETFGQTASESLACGTPVVAFDNSGLNDVINHKETGYLAESFNIEDFTNGIRWTLENKEQLSINARNKALEYFGIDKYVDSYFNAYKSILS